MTYLVAVSTDKTTKYGVEGILAYLVLYHYEKRECCRRTAIMRTSIVEESVLGVELYHAVLSALIDATLSASHEKEEGYKTVVVNVPFRDDQPALIAYRDVLLDNGFEQVGRLKVVLETKGVLLDQLLLERFI